MSATNAYAAATQANAVAQTPALSKSGAILGSASKLDALMAQQGASAGASYQASFATLPAPAVAGTASSAERSPPHSWAIFDETTAEFIVQWAPTSIVTPAAPSGFATGTKAPPAPLLGPGRTNAPDVFGSVAMPVRHTPLDAKWRAVDREALGEGPWSPLIRSLSSKSPLTQVGDVNHWVNARISFASDASTQGKSDDWAGAARSLRAHRGDCEDYAIAKLQILRAMGFSEDNMYLVIAHDLVRRADHAILAVRVGGELKILDSETDALLDGRAAQDYRPIVSYSGNHAWVHGFQVARPTTAIASGPAPSPFQLASR